MAKIVLVEDDNLLQKLYKEAFEKDGYTLMFASDGQQGLELIKEQKPDLIILDIMLPGGMNGFDVMENLKRIPNLKSIPILVLTNLDSEKETAEKIGAVDYIVKANSNPDEVVKRVEGMLQSK